MSRWRYLEDDGVGAAAGLAADEVLMQAYGRDEPAPPDLATVRLYTYRSDCALVGRYQSLEDEIDLEFCRAHDVEVGRRPTGGGAIIMGSGQLGVAVTASARPEETPREALKRYAEGVIGGLAELGIEAAFRSKNDLEVDDRKIAGLGLYLDPRGAILFHSSVLVDLDVARMLSVLRIPGAKLSDKAVGRVQERVTTVSRELGKKLQAGEVREAFASGLAAAFGAELVGGDLDPSERRRTVGLVESRYGNDAWIRQRSPRRDARGSALVKTPMGLLRIYAAVHGEVLKSVLVTGDFNVLPASIRRLEAELRWCHADPVRIEAAATRAQIGDELGVPAAEVAAAVWSAAQGALGLQQASHPWREGSCYFPEGEAATATTEEG